MGNNLTLNNQMVNTMYNYYDNNVAPKPATKYDTHKNNELKSIYNNIVASNKHLPLYKISLSNETQDYAINIKNSALNLKNVSNFLADKENDVFNKLIAVTSNPDIVSAKLISEDYSALPENANFKVEQLATIQTNTGNYLGSNLSSIKFGTYNLSLNVEGNISEFSFTVNSGDTNLQIQQNFATALNNSNLGVDASVIMKGNTSALLLQSSNTGYSPDHGDIIFSFLQNSEMAIYADKVFGLNQITELPKNSRFYINNDVKETLSNTITLNKSVEITFHNTSDESVSLGFDIDTEKIIPKIEEFVDAYNNIIDIANKNLNTQKSARKLLIDIGNATRKFKNDLESSGLLINPDGYIETDKALMTDSILSGSMQEMFDNMSKFKTSVIEQTNKISMNPMEYVDKLLVTYPNPQKSYTNPYMPSIYSGMLYNNYL